MAISSKFSSSMVQDLAWLILMGGNYGYISASRLRRVADGGAACMPPASRGVELSDKRALNNKSPETSIAAKAAAASGCLVMECVVLEIRGAQRVNVSISESHNVALHLKLHFILAETNEDCQRERIRAKKLVFMLYTDDPK